MRQTEITSHKSCGFSHTMTMEVRNMTGFHEVPAEQMERWKAYGEEHGMNLWELATVAIEKLLEEEQEER